MDGRQRSKKVCFRPDNGQKTNPYRSAVFVMQFRCLCGLVDMTGKTYSAKSKQNRAKREADGALGADTQEAAAVN
jgi:hypothetical protein